MRSYAYSGYLWLPFLLAVFIAFLAWYGWRRRSVPGALPFSMACVFAVAWCIGSLFETAAVTYGTKIFWLRFLTLWQLPVDNGGHLFRTPVFGLEPLADPPQRGAAGRCRRFSSRPSS